MREITLSSHFVRLIPSAPPLRAASGSLSSLALYKLDIQLE